MPTRFRSQRVEAIVLRHQDWGEADRLLWLYARELGKVRALAKGVRKMRSRKAGHLEPFTRVNLLLASGRDILIITQAEASELYLAVRADLGVTSFEDLIKKKIPLKMATVPDNSRALGFLYPEFLKAYGTSIEEVKSWGGGVVGADLGGQAIDKIISGEANALFHEGDVPIAPNWKTLNDKIPMRVLSIRPEVMEKLQQFGFMKADYQLEQGKYPGVTEDVSTLDYSDWIVIADSSVPDEIAYQMAMIGVERKDAFESQYPGMLPQGSKELGQYLADPKEMWKNLGVPLHPGAAKYFREKGLMP